MTAGRHTDADGAPTDAGRKAFAAARTRYMAAGLRQWEAEARAAADVWGHDGGIQRLRLDAERKENNAN